MKNNRWNAVKTAAAAVSLTMMMSLSAFAEEYVSAEMSEAVVIESEEAAEETSAVIEAGVQASKVAILDEMGRELGAEALPVAEISEAEVSGEDGVAVEDAEIPEEEAEVEEAETSGVSLNVPQVYALDSRWKSKRFDPRAKDTIGKTGCALCCLTAAMSYIDEVAYRPDELCKRMSFSNGAMAWYGEIDGKFKTNQTYSLDTIKAKLLKDEPVIVKSYQRAKTKSGQWYNKAHFVVVTGFEDHGESAADFSIMDPGKRNTAGLTLADHFSDYPNNKQLYYLK